MSPSQIEVLHVGDQKRSNLIKVPVSILKATEVALDILNDNFSKLFYYELSRYFKKK